IEMDLYFFERRHAFLNFVIDQLEKLLQLFTGIDDFDDDWQILREPLDLERVQAAVRAKAQHTAEDGCSCQALLARFHDNPFVQQLAIVSIALAYEDPKQITLGR